MSVPTKWQIAQHWNGSPDRGAFAPMLEALEHPCCFACAWYSERWARETPRSSWERATLERAHIVPSSLGGVDLADNLILLCAPCHRDSPDWHEPSAMAAWIAQRPDRSSKEIEEMSDWCAAFQQVPEFQQLLAGLEAHPTVPVDMGTRRLVDMLWQSTLKAGTHASSLSSGTKVAIMRDTALRAAGLAEHPPPSSTRRPPGPPHGRAAACAATARQAPKAPATSRARLPAIRSVAMRRPAPTPSPARPAAGTRSGPEGCTRGRGSPSRRGRAGRRTSRADGPRSPCSYVQPATGRSVQHAEPGVWPAVRAGFDAGREGLPRLVAGGRVAAFRRIPAVPGVYADGAAADSDALLDQPVRRRCGRSPRFLGGQAGLFSGDPSAGPFQVLQLHPFQEAEEVEAGRLWIGHMFESTPIGACRCQRPGLQSDQLQSGS